jgi:hypothetical protein
VGISPASEAKIVPRCKRRAAASAASLGWSAMRRSTGKASFQQPYDFFFATLAVIVFTLSIVYTVRFIPQKTVDKSFGPLGFDKGNKSPDSEIV